MPGARVCVLHVVAGARHTPMLMLADIPLRPENGACVETVVVVPRPPLTHTL
jgi:hypothetical protein